MKDNIFTDCDGLKNMYKFNHKHDSITRALGIRSDRLDKLGKFMTILVKKFNKTSEVIQAIVNCDRLHNCEKIFLLVMYGGFVGDIRRTKAKIIMTNIDNPDKVDELMHFLKAIHEIKKIVENE